MVCLEQLCRNDILHASHGDLDLWCWRKSYSRDLKGADEESVFVFTCVWGFLVASFPRYAASAMAGNTLVRCLWAAGFPLFADPVSLAVPIRFYHADCIDVSRFRGDQGNQHLSRSSSRDGAYPIRTILLRIKVEKSIDVLKVVVTDIGRRVRCIFKQ